MNPSYPAYRRESNVSAQPTILGAIQARPKLLVSVFLAVFGLFSVLILNLPKGYMSHMKLRLGPEDDGRFVNAPEAKSSNSKAATSLDGRMNLEIEVLRSTDTLTQVVAKTGLQKFEVSENQDIGVTSPLTIERALQRLQEHLRVERVGQSNMVEVSLSAPTGELAAATLLHLAEVYPKVRVKVYGEPGNYKFFHRQSATWRQQMDEAENDLVHFRRRNSEFVLPEERDALGKRTVEAQAAFEQADAQVAQYRRKVVEAREKLKAVSPAKAEQNRVLFGSEAVGRQLMTLVDLIARRADLENRLPRNERLMRETDQGIRTVKAALNRTLADPSDRSSELNPVVQSAQVTLISSETELAGLQALREHLKQIAETYKAQMFRLADAEIRDTALVRQVKHTEEQYLQYLKWQEQALAAEGIARENLLNFAIVERPTVPIEAVTPPVAIDLALACLISMCCGLAVVLCVEFLTPRPVAASYVPVKTIPVELDIE